MELPWFKFFPGDFLYDQRLTLCSLEAQGLWLRLICVMHSSARRGFLQDANGSALTSEQLCQLTGRSPAEITRLLPELCPGVFSANEDGVIYCRRMRREAELNKARSEAGKKGGEAKQNAKQTASKSPSKSASKPLVYRSGNGSLEEVGGLGEGETDPVVSVSKVRFTPPSLEEVASYCQERRNSVDPERFMAFYESKGWKVGNQPMRNWKAAIITWEKNSYGNAKPTAAAGSKPPPSQRFDPEYDYPTLGDDSEGDAEESV